MFNPVSINDDAQQATSSGFCIFEGILKVSSDLSSMLWTSLIMYSVYVSIVWRGTVETWEKFYLALGYVLPVIAAGMYLYLYIQDQLFSVFTAIAFTTVGLNQQT